MLASVDIGEWMTLGLMALALGLDAFSASVGLGMQRLGPRSIAALGLSIGLLHTLMPLAGILTGQLIGGILGHLAIFSGGLLLIIFGLNMIYSSFFGPKKGASRPKGYGLSLLLFAVSVSIDSFSVGISLGFFNVNMMLAVILIGLAALLLTWTGLILGRFVGGWMGHYGEAVGGMILFIFGLQFLF